MDELIKEFEIYLNSENISTLTIKNYSVDLRNFLEWLVLKLKTKGVNFDEDSAAGIMAKVNSSSIEEYRYFLTSNQTPDKTIYRRLSTLRKLGKYAAAKGYISFNPIQTISNDSPLMQFGKYLSKSGVSKVTAKNYISDIRQFINFFQITAVFLIILLPYNSLLKIFIPGGSQWL